LATALLLAFAIRRRLPFLPSVFYPFLLGIPSFFLAHPSSGASWFPAVRFVYFARWFDFQVRFTYSTLHAALPPAHVKVSLGPFPLSFLHKLILFFDVGFPLPFL